MLLLSLFAGIGWAFLFFALSHLLLSIPFSNRLLIRLIEGKDFTVPTLPVKTVRGIFIRGMIIIFNIFWFSLAYAAFKVNIRILDILR